MPRLLVFNPEHDYALAHGGDFYTPPVSVKTLAEKLELVPLSWAEGNDFILLHNDSIVKASEPNKVLDRDKAVASVLSIEPWGWDNALSHRLRLLGVAERLLPEKAYIESLRRLSHRRISIAANKALNAPSVPREFSSIVEALNFYDENQGCFFKMPWSSGGRGVLATEELTHSQVTEWVRGAIRRQGSVMGEIGVRKIIDFASLWHVDRMKVTFLGLSVYRCDGRGKYDGNISDSQENLFKIIRDAVPSFSREYIERQKIFIGSFIAPVYQGHLGIDMMGDIEGKVFPCVEINLRRTMGHVAMAQYRNHNPSFRHHNVSFK